MKKEFNNDLIGGLSDEERFVLRAAAVLDNSLGVLSPLEQARLDAARQSALLRVTAEPGEHSAFARTLTTSEEQIPDDIRHRLDGIRAQAMARAREKQHDERAARSRWNWLRVPRDFAVPAGAFASVCVLVTTLAVFNTADSPDVIPVALSDDGLLIASAEELELYQNLEFYQWLADNGLQN